MERTSGEEYFNKTIVSKKDSSVEMKCYAATKVCKRSLREETQG